jgi:phage portal protein BeeE
VTDGFRTKAGNYAAGAALTGGPYGFPSETAWTGIEKEAELHDYGWVYAATRAIANRIARQPIRVAKRAKGKRPSLQKGLAVVDQHPFFRWQKKVTDAAPLWLKDAHHHGLSNIEPMDNHPLLELLSDPNDFMVGYSLVFNTIVEMLITGRAFWWFTEDAGRDVIYPVPASWLVPYHEEGEPFSYYILRPWRSMVQQVIPREEIVRFYFPDPRNPLLGSLSPLMAHFRAVLADEKIQLAQARMFDNGIFPDVMLTVGRNPNAQTPGGANRPMLTKEQRDSIIRAIRERYAGAAKHGEPLILDALIEDAKRLFPNIREMDFMKSGQSTKERITQGFGVNPIVLGQIEGANRASAVVADEVFCNATVNPLIQLLSQCFCKFVCPRFGDNLVAWIEDARADDVEARRADYAQLAQFGSITHNEHRAAFGLEPLDGPEGDALIQPAGGRGATPEPYGAPDVAFAKAFEHHLENYYGALDVLTRRRAVLLNGNGEA